MRPAEYLHDLFQLYATWSEGGRVGGVNAASVGRLLQQLDLLEGVPPDKVNAYVYEVMHRADQDHDGYLSLPEFTMWWHTEVAALIPLKQNARGGRVPAPLYNIFVYFMLIEADDGARRKAVGLLMFQFLRLCKVHRIISGTVGGGQVAKMAMLRSAGDRVQGKMEAGTRLQFVQFVHALVELALILGTSADFILFLASGDGSAPLRLSPKPDAKEEDRKAVLKRVTDLYLEGPMEGSMRWTKYECEMCGQTHARCMVTDVREMKEFCSAVRVRYEPHFPLINTRNVRAVFLRYCNKYNRGLTPPSSSSSSSSAAVSHVTSPLAAGCGNEAGMAADAGGSRGGPCLCNYKALSVMELQTFTNLCYDNIPIYNALKHGELHRSKVEAAFMTACSIAGVYCSDTSIGVHDQQATASELKLLSRPVSSGAPFQSTGGRLGGGTVRPMHHGSPFDAPTARAPRISSRPGGGGAGSSSGGGSGHRRPVPTLTFPQFLEALRLLSEDYVKFSPADRGPPQPPRAHLQLLTDVEGFLWSVLFHLAKLGCPLRQNILRCSRRTRSRVGYTARRATKCCKALPLGMMEQARSRRQAVAAAGACMVKQPTWDV
ncbi:hypothetical protein FOA52_007573 [Chlamydomonas sp. UWO 241]|nr:hypothetical protein FOA52_007573 [Chlamydomonas sp. UWO 241]